MKTNNLSRLAVLLLVISNACTRQDDPGLDQTPSQAISVIADTQQEPGTRSTLSGLNTCWVAGTDQIGIFSPQAKTTQEGSVPARNVAFTAQSSARSSAFTGTMYWGSTSTAHSFYAYYPYNSGYSGSQTAVPISLSANQTQTQAGNSDHLGALDFLAASPVAITSPSVAGELGGSLNLNFNHVFSMIEFQIKGSGSLSQVRLTGASPLALETGACTIDLTQTPGTDAYTITQNATSALVSVTLGTPATLSSETAASIYMMVLPGTQSAGVTISLKVGDTWKEMAKTLSSGSFIRGKKYVIALNSDDTGWSNNVFTDARDGNSYPYLTIGTQVWMTKNLAYLPAVSPVTSGSTTEPYYYVYSNTGTDVTVAKAMSNYSTYGVLYNWPAAMYGSSSSGSNPSGVKGICPDGWHLPSDAEWTQLVNSLGGSSYAGGKMKETGYTYWNSPNSGATNSGGFTALGAGYRWSSYGGQSWDKGNYAFFWSSTEASGYPYSRSLAYNNATVSRNGSGKDDGLSVRCVKD